MAIVLGYFFWKTAILIFHKQVFSILVFHKGCTILYSQQCTRVLISLVFGSSHSYGWGSYIIVAWFTFFWVVMLNIFVGHLCIFFGKMSSEKCCFFTIDCIFWCTQIFNFDVVYFLAFLLLPVLLVLRPRNHCWVKCHEAFPQCFFFSLRVLVLVLTFRSWIYWVNFCIQFKERDQLHSFACGHHFSSITCWNACPFPNGLGTLAKNHLTMYLNLLPGSYSTA